MFQIRYPNRLGGSGVRSPLSWAQQIKAGAIPLLSPPNLPWFWKGTRLQLGWQTSEVVGLRRPRSVAWPSGDFLYHDWTCPTTRPRRLWKIFIIAVNVLLHMVRSLFFIFTISKRRLGTFEEFVVVVMLLFYVHGKHLRSCRDGQLT